MRLRRRSLFELQCRRISELVFISKTQFHVRVFTKFTSEAILSIIQKNLTNSVEKVYKLKNSNIQKC